MTIVILQQDQHYIDLFGAIKFAPKGSKVNVDESFLKLIEGKYKTQEEEEEKEEEDLSKMNKSELIAFAKKNNLNKTDEEFAKMTKKQIIEELDK